MLIYHGELAKAHLEQLKQAKDKKVKRKGDANDN
jgi:hypothetical protein